MEEELKCPICKKFYTNPVLLNCGHSICLACAVGLQSPAIQSDFEQQDFDKLSLNSETDSGIICSSRPNSYVGTPNSASLLALQSTVVLQCPVCKRLIWLDASQGAAALTRNRALARIVEKQIKDDMQYCQICTEEATDICEQCEVFYCKTCKQACHPNSGPLSNHNFIAANEGSTVLKLKQDGNCKEHSQILSTYCMDCKILVCSVCCQRHIDHESVPIGNASKAQKNRLSLRLQQLSEKAKTANEFCQRLKSAENEIETNAYQLQANLVEQFDRLMRSITNKRDKLVEQIAKEREAKLHQLRDRATDCKRQLQKTNGFIQFSIELLKETDSVAFLQTASPMMCRAAEAERCFLKKFDRETVATEFDIAVDLHPAAEVVEHIKFTPLQPPKSPKIVRNRCSVQGNSVTVAWLAQADNFVLEMDDGSGENFHKVYSGKDRVCTVDGLLYGTVYKARVAAFNSAGGSPYSPCVSFQTEQSSFNFSRQSVHVDDEDLFRI